MNDYDPIRKESTDTAADKVPVCPACDYPRPVRRRESHRGNPAGDDNAYRCPNCTETFDEPRSRTLGNQSWGGSRLGSKLRNGDLELDLPSEQTGGDA